MIKYKVSHYEPFTISQVEVERETKRFVWIDWRKEFKTTWLRSYHNTWREAHDHIVARERRRARASLERSEARLRKIESMRPPKDEGVEA